MEGAGSSERSAQARGAEITLFVARDGDDAWSGTRERPDRGKTDGPLATLMRARDVLREMRGKSSTRGPFTVLVRGGKYMLGATLSLGAADSGREDAPVRYAAYPGEEPILSGGRRLTGWKPYKGKILQCEAPAEVRRGGRAPRQLFCDAKRMPRARWPKIDTRDDRSVGWARMEGGAEEGSTTAFRYKAGTFRQSWKKPTQGEVNYFCYGEWANCIVGIRSIDEGRRIITLEHEGYQFLGPPWYARDYLPGLQTFQPGNRFCVENVLEELDRPGEWCFDGEEGVFYFWPEHPGIEEQEVVAPALDRLIDLDGASYVTISGFTFTETSDGDNTHPDATEGCGAMYARAGLRYAGEAVRLANAQHCTIEDNRFDCVGGNGVYLEGFNSRNAVRRNEIAGAGANGVCLAGSKMRQPVANEVSDNHIHQCGAINTYTAGIFLGTSGGNRIAHNRIEELPHHGIQLGENPSGRNIVEFNEIRRVARECHDSAAINCWMERPPKESERCGHVIRYNLIADSYSYETGTTPPKKYWTFGIYLDNYSSNCVVYGNIVIRASSAGILVHGGKNNVIENNILVDCGTNLRLQNGISQWRYWKENGFEYFMTGNHFRRNICFQRDGQAKLISLYRWTEGALASCDENVFFRAGGGSYEIEDEDAPNGPGAIPWERWRGLGFDVGSVIADPLFAAPEKDDYGLRPGSPAFGVGFQPIDASAIGRRK
ncbi:MAG: right-handed parallel beta-helix repeat-containing protein [Planctomycetota bacterium]